MWTQESYPKIALRVLQETREAMTTRQITEWAISHGLLTPQTKTPVSTMSAALYTLIRDKPDTPITRLHEPGEKRAKAGSVRWVLKSTREGPPLDD
jgi:hypothetical protein